MELQNACLQRLRTDIQAWAQFPAFPGWGLLLALVGGSSPILRRALGAVPRHSWLGSAVPQMQD